MATKLEKEVTRECDGLILRITKDGLYLREKGRRTEVGPRTYQSLYQDLVQQASGFNPLKPRKPKGRSRKVSRGLLSTEAGR